MAWSTELEATLSERNRWCAICTHKKAKPYLSDYDRSYHKIHIGSTSLAGIHIRIAPSVYAVAEELKKFVAERPALTKIHKREKALERLQKISSVLNKIAENYSALLVATSCQHDQCKNDGCKCPCHNGAEEIYPEDMLNLLKSLTPPLLGITITMLKSLTPVNLIDGSNPWENIRALNLRYMRLRFIGSVYEIRKRTLFRVTRRIFF